MSGYTDEIRAVFFDVDGTLLSHKTRRIPESTVRALHVLQTRGIRVVVATGRHKLELDVLPLEQIRYDGYIILNGQLCLDADRRPYFGSPITGADRETLIRIYEDREMPVILIDQERLYLNYTDDYVRQVQTAVPAAIPAEAPFPGGDIYMGCLFGPRELDDGRGKLFEGLKLTRWHNCAADIIPADGGKVRGIRRYLEEHHLTPAQIMAFGDEENDLEMLRFAGVGVAMGNGNPRVKAQADYVTEDIDADGVEKALRHFGLI